VAYKTDSAFVSPTLTRTYRTTGADEPGGGGAGFVTFNPPGIASEEAFGAHRFGVVFQPTSIASAQAFGALKIAGSTGAFLPVGIASAEAFSLLRIGYGFRPASIPSGEHFGSVGFKTRPEPYQVILTLVGGPYDGRSVMVEQPWPRHSYIVEDPDTGEHYTYFVDVNRTHEPYVANYAIAGPTGQDDEDPNYVPKGEKGDRGETGEKGDTGPAGSDGADYIVTLPPTPWPSGHAASTDGEWVIDASGSPAGYEPWGYRVEGENLVFKGVHKSTVGMLIPTSLTYNRVGNSFGAAIVWDSSTNGIEIGLFRLTSGGIDVAYVTTGATRYVVGFEQLRIPIDYPPPP